MLVSKKLNVTSSEVYDVFLEALKAEIEFCTGSKITPKEGFKYEKEFKTKMGNKTTATVIIDKLVKDNSYKLIINHNDDINIVEYTLEDDGTGTVVTYLEEFDSDVKKKRINQNVTELVLTFFTKRKAKKKLAMIERYIVANRGV